MDEQIEQIAVTLFAARFCGKEADGPTKDKEWGDLSEETREHWRFYARAAHSVMAGRLAELTEAGRLALRVAESWIHDQLDGTSMLDNALAELDPARAALAPPRHD